MSMKKVSRWKSFDFGPQTSVDEKNCQPIKPKTVDPPFTTTARHRDVKRAKRNIDFQKQIEPKNVEDLIVHPKKIKELEGWLKSVVPKNRQAQKTEFLLLAGPTGSGKSSAVRVLCKSMDIDITEWSNPIDIDFEILKGPGQVTTFLEFFGESKYCSLLSKENNKKVLLVKEFPNVLIRHPEEFSNVLEEIWFKATNPVIFICTDSNSKESNLQRSFFPEDILLKYLITHISVNACASTLLKKGLRRALDIIQTFPDLFCSPSQSTIEAILASSMGDIRCAVNQLYLSSVVGNSEIPIVKSEPEKTGRKRKRNESSGTIKHMTKDETLGLFHGLGRVLNPKRRKEGSSWRLNCDIQKLVDEFSIQPTKFTSFLFENYLKYFGDLDDVGKAADVLSFSTALLDKWENPDALIIALWIAVDGLLIFNEHKASKWNQIKGPKKIANIRDMEGSHPHPADKFYYNVITKTKKYHAFNCDP